MNKLWTLTNLQLKNYWYKMLQNMGTSRKKVFMFLALVWLVFIFGVMSVNMSFALYEATSALNMTELTFSIPFIMVSLGVMVLSITALINLFYYSDNTGFLLSLPVKENSIILSKLAVQYVFSLVMSSVFIMPPIFIYFMKSGVTIVGLLGGLITVFLVPVVPLLIASILVVLLMKTIGKSVNRRAMSVIMSVLALVVIFGIQAFVTRSASSSDFLTKILSTEDGLLTLIGMKFPPVVWATKMITGSLLHLALFVVLNIVLIVLFNALAQPLVKTTLRNFNQAESRVIVKKASYQGRSKIGALIRRNLFIIYKTPAFLMNTVMLLIFPFLIIAINMLSGTQSIESVKALMESLASPGARPWLAIILAGTFISPSLMGGFTATAITREGKYLWQTKIAPVSAKEDILARIASCAIIIGLGAVIMLILAFFVLPLSILDIIWALLITIPAVYGILAIDMCVDINRPILNWTNPTQAMKNNMNLLAGFAWKALVGVIMFLALKILGGNLTASTLKYALFAMSLILGAVGHILLQQGIKKYQSIEIK